MPGRTQLILLACLLACTASAQETFTLEQSLRLAVANGAAVQQAEETLLASGEKVRESRAARYPFATLSAAYMRLGPVQEFTIPMGPLSYTMQMGVENSYSAGVGIQYQLFNWGRTGTAIEVSDWGRKISEEGVSGAKIGAAWQMTQVFYGILLSDEAIAVLEKTLEAWENRLAAVRQRVDAGLMSRYDLRSVEVQRSSARGRLLDARAGRDKLGLLFNRLAGRPQDAPVRLAGALACDGSPGEADSLAREAFERRVELRQARLQEGMARRQSDLARTGDKPILAVNAAYGFRNGYFPDLDVLRQNWSAGVSLSWPLFDGFRTAAQSEQAEIAARLARLRAADLQNAIALEVRQASVDLALNRDKIALEETKRIQAEDALAIAEERYEKGLQSTLELLDAQNAVENARLNLLQSVYNCVISRCALEKAVGISFYAE